MVPHRQRREIGSCSRCTHWFAPTSGERDVEVVSPCDPLRVSASRGSRSAFSKVVGPRRELEPSRRFFVLPGVDTSSHARCTGACCFRQDRPGLPGRSTSSSFARYCSARTSLGRHYPPTRNPASVIRRKIQLVVATETSIPSLLHVSRLQTLPIRCKSRSSGRAVVAVYVTISATRISR